MMKYLIFILLGLFFYQINLIGQETGSFTDKRDGKTYKTVKLGEQVWMAENLAYLPKVYPPMETSSNKTRYYVFHYEGYDVEEAKNTGHYTTFGVLYNYKAAEKGCPTGWHLPTEKDWTILEMYITGREYNEELDYWDDVRAKIEGVYLKADQFWPNGDPGTDSLGFSAIPAGANWKGNFEYLYSMTKWWTKFHNTDTDGFYYYRQLDESNTLYRFNAPVEMGFSVRCIKE